MDIFVQKKIFVEQQLSGGSAANPGSGMQERTVQGEP